MLRYGFLGGLLALFESCAFIKYTFLDSLHSFQSAFDKLSRLDKEVTNMKTAMVRARPRAPLLLLALPARTQYVMHVDIGKPRMRADGDGYNDRNAASQTQRHS